MIKLKAETRLKQRGLIHHLPFTTYDYLPKVQQCMQ